MSIRLKYVVSMLGAGVLATSLITNVMAGHPPFVPAKLSGPTKTQHGNFVVTGALHVNKNTTIYGHAYARDGLQVTKGLRVTSEGLTVDSGGIKGDSLVVAGPLSAASGTFLGNLQAGAITGNSLSLSGGLTAAGKITSNGVDAGAGGLTTSGAVTAGGITDSGSLAAGSTTVSSLTDNGDLTARAANLTNLTVSGNVNFTNANLTGLSLGGINLSNLNIGSPSGTNAPLNLSENGKTAQLGVDQSGALTINGEVTSAGLTSSGSISTTQSLSVGQNATIGGNVLVSGPGITAASLQAPPASSASTAPGTLTLGGSTILANGTLTLAGADDLTFATPNGSSAPTSHILANGDADLAGTANIVVPANANATVDASVTFRRPYSTSPIVTVTPADNAAQSSTGPGNAWVTVNGSNGSFTGFTIHYVPPADSAKLAAGYTTTFNYIVVGS